MDWKRKIRKKASDFKDSKAFQSHSEFLMKKKFENIWVYGYILFFAWLDIGVGLVALTVFLHYAFTFNLFYTENYHEESDFERLFKGERQ